MKTAIVLSIFLTSIPVIAHKKKPINPPDGGSSCPPSGKDPCINNPLCMTSTTDGPCNWDTQCADGLVCNYSKPQQAYSACGSCTSAMNSCDSIPVDPYGCGSSCQPYIRKGVNGSGCEWYEDCAPGLLCDYSEPQSDYCGTCR